MKTTCPHPVRGLKLLMYGMLLPLLNVLMVVTGTIVRNPEAASLLNLITDLLYLLGGCLMVAGTIRMLHAYREKARKGTLLLLWAGIFMIATAFAALANTYVIFGNPGYQNLVNSNYQFIATTSKISFITYLAAVILLIAGIIRWQRGALPSPGARQGSGLIAAGFSARLLIYVISFLLPLFTRLLAPEKQADLTVTTMSVITILLQCAALGLVIAGWCKLMSAIRESEAE